MVGLGAVAIELGNGLSGYQIPIGLQLTGFCLGLLLLLAGAITTASAILRIQRRTFLVVLGAALGITASLLLVFVLTFDPLF